MVNANQKAPAQEEGSMESDRVLNESRELVYFTGSEEDSMVSNHTIALKSCKLMESGKKYYPCQTCPQSFSLSGSLKRHMFVHSGDKPYPCKTCPKSFTSSGDLKKHMLIHSGEKPHSCQLCILTFRLHKQLIVHIRKVHRV